MLAVVIGALVAAFLERPRLAVGVGGLALVVIFLAASAWALGANLRATMIDASMALQTRPDWEAASKTVAAGTSADAIVLFDVSRQDVADGKYAAVLVEPC